MDRYNSYVFIASSINDTKHKKALFLHIGGKELQKIHRTLNDESDTKKQGNF